MTKEHAGFSSTCLMGHGVAIDIVETGYSLTVTAYRNRASVDDFIGNGAVEATLKEA